MSEFVDSLAPDVSVPVAPVVAAIPSLVVGSIVPSVPVVGFMVAPPVASVPVVGFTVVPPVPLVLVSAGPSSPQPSRAAAVR